MFDNYLKRSVVDERLYFLRKTYLHLLGAMLVFTGLIYVLMNTKIGYSWINWAKGSAVNMLLVLGAFIGVSWLAKRWSRSDTSRIIQYIGLTVYVVVQAFIFMPLLQRVVSYNAVSILPAAALITILTFLGLTLYIFVSNKDFSFLRSTLVIGILSAIVLVIASAIFGFQLGILFSVAMVALACGCILYDTSRVLAHYPPTHHVNAALALFSSMTLLFFYVIRTLLHGRD